MTASSHWIDSTRFTDPISALRHAATIDACGVTQEALKGLHAQWTRQVSLMDRPDVVLECLSSFLLASANPESLLTLFERDPKSFSALVQIFSSWPKMASHLIETPDAFDQLLQSEGQPIDRRILIEDLNAKLESVDTPERAADVIGAFVRQENLRVAYGEFVRSMIPEKVGRQLSFIADAVVRSSLSFLLNHLDHVRGTPMMPSGNAPQVTVIGLGGFGGEELSYGESLPLVFLFDRIDQWNPSHRSFYNTLVRKFIDLLNIGVDFDGGYNIDLRQSPKYETGTLICSSFEAVRVYETSGRTWQRMSFIKARVVAGSAELGNAFLNRLEPWVYRRFISRADLAEIRTFQHKLKRRSLTHDTSTIDSSSCNVVRDPGGRHDIERTIQFLQLLHGDRLPNVRKGNTYDALVSLEKSGCLTHQEASLLSENHARLCRLQHQLAIMFSRYDDQVPTNPADVEHLAWQLGIRKEGSLPKTVGDVPRFRQQLDEIFGVNRRMISHLMLDAPDDGTAVPAETELMLDPDPSPQLTSEVLAKHHFSHPSRAYDDLVALSTESVPFLSPHRCRHFFAQIAPTLLSEISQTPDPDGALAALVRVADSIGAKATLWELLGGNRPTMQLMVRLCAAAPYLVEILNEHPGMIDELIDSLLMDQLPSAERLDAQSIELSRGAQEIDLILHSFKNSSHLMIGVRNILGKETLAATQQAIGDTAEACLRRVIEFERERLALQYGDPMGADGSPAELLTLALGKLGGREPNYHSDLDAIFLYSSEGETQRRVGGPRATTTNRSFFNQLARRVIERINWASPNGRLYELDGRLRPTGEEGVIAVSVPDFLNRFQKGEAPLWQWLAICKARTISGSRRLRKKLDSSIASLIADTPWHDPLRHDELLSEIRKLRTRMEETATPGNLKRGTGGTVDVEFIAQMLTLRYAKESPQVFHPNTCISLTHLAEAGRISEEDSLQLIAGYQTLRGVEINLRLLQTSQRHQLPDEPSEMNNLAFLMNESDPQMIVAACSQARQRNRRMFERFFQETN